MLLIEQLSIPDVKVLTIARHGDDRGVFSETYNRKGLAEAGISTEFVQDNHSWSQAESTLRGLHMQAPPFAQAKLVRVARGSILDVAVDIRKGSPTFGNWVSAIISARDWNQIFVPVGFLHGFITLEPETEVLYKTSHYYNKGSEGGVIWNDPQLNIDWAVKANPVLSEKDALLPLFKDFNSPFMYETD